VVDFARALGVESTGEDMDVDDAPSVKGFEGIKKKVKELIRKGYSASQILSQVSNSYYIKHASFTRSS
jgi:replication factor C subunit 2/4